MSVDFCFSKVNLVYITSNSDFENTNALCEICKKTLECDDYVSVGICGHAFHEKCMSSIVSCPIDNIKWQVKYTVNVARAQQQHIKPEKRYYPNILRHNIKTKM